MGGSLFGKRRDIMKKKNNKIVTFYCPRGCNQMSLVEGSYKECATCGQVMSPDIEERYNDVHIEQQYIAQSNRQGNC